MRTVALASAQSGHCSSIREQSNCVLFLLTSYTQCRVYGDEVIVILHERTQLINMQPCQKIGIDGSIKQENSTPI